MSCKKAAAVLPAFGSVTPELPVLGHLVQPTSPGLRLPFLACGTG